MILLSVAFPTCVGRSDIAAARPNQPTARPHCPLIKITDSCPLKWPPLFPLGQSARTTLVAKLGRVRIMSNIAPVRNERIHRTILFCLFFLEDGFQTRRMKNRKTDIFSCTWMSGRHPRWVLVSSMGASSQHSEGRRKFIAWEIV